MQLEEIALPVSGLQVQWRSADDHFRIRPLDNAQATDPPDDELPWRPWLGHNDMAVGASGTITGEPDELWWAVWGEYTGDDVEVTLADSTHPEVIIVGKLWIAEWRGTERAATVVTVDRQAEVQFAPRAFRTPPAEQTSPTKSDGRKHLEAPAGFHTIPEPDRRP